MKQLKPLNLEQALAGAPVVTRNGCPIVEIKYMQSTDNLAVVRDEDGHYVSYFVPCSGKLSNTIDHATDLFMAQTKKEGYINIYTDEHSNKHLAVNSTFVYIEQKRKQRLLVIGLDTLQQSKLSGKNNEL